MRHGEAIPFAPLGHDRPLTSKGKVEATRTANLLKAARLEPRKFLCSTRLRAKETAELVKALVAPECSVKTIDGITPDDRYEKALIKIELHAADATLVVFHQPILTQIIGWLTGGSAQIDILPRAATATAYLLDVDAFLPGGAILKDIYQP